MTTNTQAGNEWFATFISDEHAKDTGKALALEVLQEMDKRAGEVRENLRFTFGKDYALAQCVYDGWCEPTEHGTARLAQLLRIIRTYPANG